MRLVRKSQLLTWAERPLQNNTPYARVKARLKSANACKRKKVKILEIC